MFLNDYEWSTDEQFISIVVLRLELCREMEKTLQAWILKGQTEHNVFRWIKDARPVCLHGTLFEQ